MNARLQRLRAELRFDREAFDKRLAELETIPLATAQASPASCAQAAVALHHAYGAIESILERISRHPDPRWSPFTCSSSASR